MTWFKSLIMRQNSPLLLIDSNMINDEEEEESRLTTFRQPYLDLVVAKSIINDAKNNNRNSDNNNNHSSSIRRLGRRKAQQVRIGRRSNVSSSSSSSSSSLSLLPLEHLLQNRCQDVQQQQQERISKVDDKKSIFGVETLTKTHYLSTQRLPHLVQEASSVTMTSTTIKATTTLKQPENNNVTSTSCQLLNRQDNISTLPKITPLKLANTSQENNNNKSCIEVNNKVNNDNNRTTNKCRRKKRKMESNNSNNNKISNSAHILLACLSTSLTLFLITTCLTSFEIAAAAQQQQYFEVQPDSQYLVQNGQDLRLRCLIRNRQGECLWLRNGRAVGTIAKKYQFKRQPEDGDCSLMIRNVSVQQDDGIWQCQVTSSDVEQDTLQSTEVHLVVLVPPERPQIKNMSQNTHRLILEENRTKFVVCEMRGGNPAPQIEWLLDNKNVTKEAQLSSTLSQSGASASSSNQRITYSKLKMSDIKRTMNGKNLTCVGVHQTINQSTSVELDVQYVPTVSVVQREYSIVEGSPLSISCQVDSNPPPNIVNWRLVSDGSTLNGRNNQQSSGAVSSPTRPGPVLEFERITKDLNQNVFECLAQNSYGISLPADVKLNVLYPPFSLNTSHSESVVVGSQAQLACLFDGNPEPEVKWHYTDPLARSAHAVQLDNNKQQYLNIKNVTYRNEGDYHCEAKNQINGVYYGVRSSNIILDVYGEPQFLVKSPVHSKAIQGTKTDVSMTFCSDPPPSKVYWQFGSIRFDVRLSNINNGQQIIPTIPQALPGASLGKQNPINQRFQVHPLQALQKRDSSFSKVPTCYEAALSILDPELTDQRDYTLVVQNERGHQSAFVRLRVTLPLSPVLMITSAFVTICGLFFMSLIVMFLVKKRQELSHHHHHQANHHNSNRDGRNGSTNGDISATMNGKANVEHLKNGSVGITQVESAAAAATTTTTTTATNNGQMMQQTRGIVNGAGNGLANGASNPIGGGHQSSLSVSSADDSKINNTALMSMASSDTSGDQKQLLSSPDRNSSTSGSTTATATTTTGNHNNNNNHHHHFNHHHHHNVDFNVNLSSTNSIDGSTGAHSTANSTPVPLNHISVEHVEDLTNHALSLQYQSSPQGSALIYANLDYTDHHQNNQLQSNNQAHLSIDDEQQQQQFSPINSNQQAPVQRRQQTPVRHSPSGSSMADLSIQQAQQQQMFSTNSHQQASPQSIVRSSVGATIAMMNSLAAANQTPPTTTVTSNASSGVLNGAINQQLANSRQIRKPGPPKPPKPSIQQRSRFYQQHAVNTGGLIMIGQQQQQQQQQADNENQTPASANELAVEYSKIAFPARAEL